MRFLFSLTLLFVACSAHALTPQELDSVGRRVWQNECGGTRDGLTSWNGGENFASLGIGHFIWYPKGAEEPFDESFPPLMKFLASSGVKVPQWLYGPCPWPSRAVFQAEFRGPRMTELRNLLANNVRLQSAFLAQRMQTALPKMLKSVSRGDRARVETNFDRLTKTSAGTFALIDYVNFKGEGIKETERYKGEGWGLLQVLVAMESSEPAPAVFARAAATVLERRVKNSPPARGEARWLPGWRSRVRAYGR